jgi:hypothetical protein
MNFIWLIKQLHCFMNVQVYCPQCSEHSSITGRWLPVWTVNPRPIHLSICRKILNFPLEYIITKVQEDQKGVKLFGQSSLWSVYEIVSPPWKSSTVPGFCLRATSSKLAGYTLPSLRYLWIS